MPTFPLLKTGVIAQYPLIRQIGYRTRVHRFVDGSEQRHPVQGQAIRRWRVQLAALDEGEVRAFRDFFISLQGRYGTFTFTDPTDGTVYSNCDLEQDDLERHYLSEFGHSAALVIRSKG